MNLVRQQDAPSRQPFVPTVRLDPSQVDDRRNRTKTGFAAGDEIGWQIFKSRIGNLAGVNAAIETDRFNPEKLAATPAGRRLLQMMMQRWASGA